MEQTLKWFTDRIGKTVIARSRYYNGEMTIDDREHASYLYEFSQKHQGYRFSDVPVTIPAANPYGADDFATPQHLTSNQ